MMQPWPAYDMKDTMYFTEQWETKSTRMVIYYYWSMFMGPRTNAFFLFQEIHYEFTGFWLHNSVFWSWAIPFIGFAMTTTVGNNIDFNETQAPCQ